MQKVKFVIVCTFVFGLSSNALGQGNTMRDGPHTVSATGSTEAQAQATAEAEMDEIIDEFELSLSPEDYITDVWETTSWDPTTMTYEITFIIFWIDQSPLSHLLGELDVHASALKEPSLHSEQLLYPHLRSHFGSDSGTQFLHGTKET